MIGGLRTTAQFTSVAAFLDKSNVVHEFMWIKPIFRRSPIVSQRGLRQNAPHEHADQ